MLGQALYETGRWDDALTEIAAVPEDLKDPRRPAASSGSPPRSPSTATSPPPHAATWRRPSRTGSGFGHRTIPPLVLARSLDREQAGALREALAVLTATFDSNPDDLGETEDLLGDAVRLALKIGDKDTAQTIAGQAATLAEGSEIPHRQANALYCRGMVDRDAAVLLAAAQRYADAGRPLPRAKALEAAAECLVEADDRTAARQAFEQAVEVYEFLGAEADLNRVQAEFRAHGIRRGPHSKHRRAVSGWDSLTDTELKIAALRRGGAVQPGDRRPAHAVAADRGDARVAHTEEAERGHQDRHRAGVGAARRDAR